MTFIEHFWVGTLYIVYFGSVLEGAFFSGGTIKLVYLDIFVVGIVQNGTFWHFYLLS